MTRQPPPSTPEGDEALRRVRALNYRVWRELRYCRHENCGAEDHLVVVVTDKGYSLRCADHCEDMDRPPGQWIDSPIHQQFKDGKS